MGSFFGRVTPVFPIVALFQILCDVISVRNLKNVRYFLKKSYHIYLSIYLSMFLFISSLISIYLSIYGSVSVSHLFNLGPSRLGL